MKFSRMELLLPLKKGRRGLQNEAWEGNKNYGAVDGQGLPIGIKFSSVTPHESKLIESTLDTVRIPRIGAGRPRTKIQRLIYDRAADYPSLRRRLLEQRGIDLICPHRKICKQKCRMVENSLDIKNDGKSNVQTLGS